MSLPNWWSASAVVRRRFLYPLARAAGRTTPPRPRRVVRTTELERLLEAAGLKPTALRPTSFRPQPFRPLGLRAFAAQFVVAAERQPR